MAEYNGIEWVGFNRRKFLGEQERDDRGRFSGPGGGSSHGGREVIEKATKSTIPIDPKFGLAPAEDADRLFDSIRPVMKEHGQPENRLEGKAKIERIPANKLIPTQPGVRSAKLREMIKGPGSSGWSETPGGLKISDHPVVVRHQGKNYIFDGHHRIIADSVRGVDPEVRVVEV